VNTKLFSGFVFVMSLKSAIVMYRVDGVSGLNDLTGIKSMIPRSAIFGAQTIIPVPKGFGNQLSAY
jgi:hypothetical protein